MENNDNKEINLVFEDNEDKKVQLFGEYVYDTNNNMKKFIEVNKGKIEYIIDGEKKDLSDISYSFKSLGVHNIKLILKDPKIIVNGMFDCCISLKSVEGLENIDISGQESLANLFNSCENLEKISDITKWDTKSIKNFSSIFFGCQKLSFIPNISEWNTSKATRIDCLFSECLNLKEIPDISKWDTSSVNDFSDLFSGCSSINEIPDISKWNTSKAVKFGAMFQNCSSLSSLPNLNEWNISNLKESNVLMFYNCSNLDKKFIPSWFKE